MKEREKFASSLGWRGGALSMLRTGNAVRHIDRSDVGIGRVTEVYPDGTCDVEFETCTFSGVVIDAFASVELEMAAIRRTQFIERVMELLLSGKTDEADSVFESDGSKFGWCRADYLTERCRVERAREEEARRKLKQKIQGNLRSGKLAAADKLFDNRKCSRWWDPRDYSRERAQAQAMVEVVDGYHRSTINGLNALLEDGRLGLLRAEMASLKQPKVHAALRKMGLQLDDEQQLACAHTEQYLLIRARAGSGKTRTLAAIAALAIDDEQLDPDQVMILAFNKKAAEEIGERVRTSAGVAEYRNARTFHSLAWNLADHRERKLIFDDGNLQPSRRKQSQFVERVVHAVLNPAFRERLYEFFRQEIEQIDRIGSSLEGEEYRVFRRAMTDFSLGGDSVKSNGEKFVADFLFEHGIQYEYEKVWSWNKQDRLQGDAYRPDFSLLAGGKDLIWEHWAIDPDDPDAEVPQWWKAGTNDYREQIESKRQFWLRRDIPLIETHVGMLRHGRKNFEDRLKGILSEYGVKCRKLDHETLIRRVAEAPRTISRMAGLFRDFISRAKKRGWNVEQVAEVIRKAPDAEPKNRVFHDLAVRAYSEYENLLHEEKAWDFDDMLISAADQVKALGELSEIGLGRGQSMKLRSLRYLLIDEFQDFSELYYRLVRAILDVNPEIRVVAVGDDWQAINAFAGAQLSFFTDFGRYFDGAGTTNITTNYRSGVGIVGAGNKIMDGLGQGARSKSGATRGHVCVRDRASVWIHEVSQTGRLCLEAAKDAGTGKVNYDLAKALQACIEFIVESVFEQDGKKWLPAVLVLARTGFVYGLSLVEVEKRLTMVLQRHPQLQDVANAIHLNAMTAHRAKGQEADTVIVLDATTGQFPKVHADNQLFGLFGVNMKDTLAEERRLFYVATTRAEHRLMFLSEDGSRSPFLLELDSSRVGDDYLSTPISPSKLRGLSLGEVAKSIMDRLSRPDE